MKFFPVALVQKTVPEIRGIFVVGSNLKIPVPPFATRQSRREGASPKSEV